MNIVNHRTENYCQEENNLYFKNYVALFIPFKATYMLL